jgi:hypothetical protein
MAVQPGAPVWRRHEIGDAGPAEPGQDRRVRVELNGRTQGVPDRTGEKTATGASAALL